MIQYSDLSRSQLECYNRILSLIADKKRRITVLMPTGSGKNVISYLLIPEIKKNGKILFLTSHRAYINEMMNQYEISDVDVKMPYEVNTDMINKYGVVILMDLRVLDRRLVNAVCENYQGITISFGSPFQELKDELNHARILSYARGVYNYVFVYHTLSIVDIRDAIEADVNEKAHIAREISNQKNLYDEKQREGLLKFEYSQKEYADSEALISNYKSRIIELTKKIKIENENARFMAELKEARKEMESFKHEKEKKESELKKLKEEFEAIRDYSIFQTQLLNGIGVDNSTVKDMYELIQNLRVEFSAELNSEFEDVRETAICKLQNMVTDLIYEKTKDFVKASESRYEELMREALSEDVWEKKLSDKSRSFLITAKVNYDSLNGVSGDYDYSGVCLLVTKALEVEVARRFYSVYFDYLKGCYASTANWPESVLVRNGHQFTNRPISEERFTLGSVVPFMGVKRIRGYTENKSGYSIYSERDHQCFVTFAKQCLYDGLSSGEVERKLEEAYLFIEKVRIDFRNPAAHKNKLTRVSADECIDYVIEIQKKLRVLLQDMIL